MNVLIAPQTGLHHKRKELQSVLKMDCKKYIMGLRFLSRQKLKLLRICGVEEFDYQFQRTCKERFENGENGAFAIQEFWKTGGYFKSEGIQ